MELAVKMLAVAKMAMNLTGFQCIINEGFLKYENSKQRFKIWEKQSSHGLGETMLKFSYVADMADLGGSEKSPEAEKMLQKNGIILQSSIK